MFLKTRTDTMLPEVAGQGLTASVDVAVMHTRTPARYLAPAVGPSMAGGKAEAESVSCPVGLLL